MAIERYSSRGHALGDVLSKRLVGAKRYLRIAGYFRSSLLEVVGEALDTVDEIRVVCNGDLDPHDVKVARAAREGAASVARTLVSSWQANEHGIDVLLARERYKRLHDLLASGKMKVRVIPRDGDNVFVHGKAGVIEHADGGQHSFVGSLNDSASGLRHAYEILWADDDPLAAQWVRDEFTYFWDQGIDLPDAVVQHVGAMAKRGEYRSIEEARDAGKGAVPTEAILADRPIYKAGQILRPWQKRFVETCVEDFQLHGSARYLIADDVGLGKTLSMAAAALVLSMLDDRPVLILAPSTLIWQWQEELEDKLGVPAAVWSTQKKCWLDGDKRALTQKGDPTLVAKCPWRMGIVSTGLIVNGDDEGERGALAKKSFGVVILDEAHKARTRRQPRDGEVDTSRNNLMDFLHQVSRNAGSVILGTATPIQLDAVELWDLMAAIGQGAPHVLGSPFNGGEWWKDTSIQYLSGQRPWPQSETGRWSLFRNPLPPANEHRIFRNVRDDFAIPAKHVTGPRFDELGPAIKSDLGDDFDVLSRQHNPIVRRVVRRTRPMLEQQGLLKPIAVVTHPKPTDGLQSHLFEKQLTAAQLLWINVIADGPPALALAFDRNPCVMNKPPRPPSSRLLDAASLRFIVISGTAKAIGGIAFLAAMPQLGYSLEETRTSVFLYESMMQLAFVYPARRIGVVPLPNVWIHVAVGLGMALQASTVVLPPLRTLLGLVPVSAGIFAAITVAVLLTWVVAEFLGRRRGDQSQSEL